MKNLWLKIVVKFDVYISYINRQIQKMIYIDRQIQDIKR